MFETERPRKSAMNLGVVYFWTATILDWKPLLERDLFKRIILNSISFLHSKQKLKIYGFVIMPNHIHLLWEMLEMNGKEMPYASFLKFTAHAFQKELRVSYPDQLLNFQVQEPEREFRFWQRDPLAFPVLTKEIAEQKLNYMHLNPLQAHWNLVKRPEEYYFSTASFYEGLSLPFDFITDYRERF